MNNKFRITRVLKGRSLAILVVAITFLLAVTARQAVVSKSEQTTPIKLLSIGDSIGNGYGLAKPWPELISARLDLPIVNLSISGEQTAWGLKHIDALLKASRPTHVLIMLGTNDVTKGAVIAESLQNLQEMANKARAQNAEVFISTILPIPGDKYSVYDQRGADLSAGIANLSGVVAVDARAKFVNPDSLLADGLHPNQRGQDLIAEAFIDVLDLEVNPKTND